MGDETKDLAADLFNGVWDLLEKENRTEDEDFMMVHQAHASLYHWMILGNPSNIYNGEWQISRVYATLNNFESCLYHALRALKICMVNHLTGFDLAYAYEALTRAYVMKGNKSECTKYLELALKEADKVLDAGSKDLVMYDLNELQDKIKIQFMN
ncbi:MAG: hypothetical protein K0S61_1195 [Anaerocolumna sp.]|jgi:hypothetical protein|nr:hypothetical protein [Anaerocolumna sp.]